MNFKKVFRGYDPKQVDKYIAETAQKEQQLRTAQKERIDELSDENYALRQQIKQYQTDEQAISKSLIASQQLGQRYFTQRGVRMRKHCLRPFPTRK